MNVGSVALHADGTVEPPRAHPAANLFPMLGEPELRELAEDIRRNGLLMPITVDGQGLVLDGRNRLRACELAGVPPRKVAYSGGQSIVAWIISMNLKRRHLTRGQTAAIAAEALPLFEAETRERQRLAGINRAANAPRDDRGLLIQLPPVREEAGSEPTARRREERQREAAAQTARVFGVGTATVYRAKSVMQASPELHEQVKLGTRTLESAATQVRHAQRQARIAQLPPPPVIPERIDQGDATRLAELLPPNSVDLICTSPPYGLNRPYHELTDPAEGWQQFMADWMAQAFVVARQHARLAVNVPLDTTEPYPRPTYAQTIAAAEAGGWIYRFTITWIEGNTTTGNRSLGSVNSAARPHHVSPVELIAVFSKGEWGPSTDGLDDILPDEWQQWGRTVWTFAGESNAWEGQSAAFPEELPRRCIKYLSRVGDTVLDPFAGSGTTVLVARKTNRRGIGFDLSGPTVESARRRLAAAP